MEAAEAAAISALGSEGECTGVKVSGCGVPAGGGGSRDPHLTPALSSASPLTCRRTRRDRRRGGHNQMLIMP